MTFFCISAAISSHRTRQLTISYPCPDSTDGVRHVDPAAWRRCGRHQIRASQNAAALAGGHHRGDPKAEKGQGGGAAGEDGPVAGAQGEDAQGIRDAPRVGVGRGSHQGTTERRFENWESGDSKLKPWRRTWASCKDASFGVTLPVHFFDGTMNRQSQMGASDGCQGRRI